MTGKEEWERVEIYSEPVFTEKDKDHKTREIADCLYQIVTYLQHLIGIHNKSSDLGNPALRHSDAPLKGIKNRMERISDPGWPTKEDKKNGKARREKGD